MQKHLLGTLYRAKHRALEDSLNSPDAASAGARDALIHALEVLPPTSLTEVQKHLLGTLYRAKHRVIEDSLHKVHVEAVLARHDANSMFLHRASIMLVAAASSQSSAWSPSREVLSAFVDAGAAASSETLVLLDDAAADVVIDAGRLFADLVCVLSSIQLCHELLVRDEALAIAKLLGGVAIHGSSPWCAAAAPLIASVVECRLIAGKDDDTRLLVRVLKRVGDAVFPSGFHVVVANILALAAQGVPAAVQLARRVGRQLPDLGRAASAVLGKLDDSLFTRRLRGMLEGGPRVCEGPNCKGGPAVGLSLCSRCRGARYCSRECQRAHRATHALGGACAPRAPIAPGKLERVAMIVHVNWVA